MNVALIELRIVRPSLIRAAMTQEAIKISKGMRDESSP